MHELQCPTVIVADESVISPYVQGLINRRSNLTAYYQHWNEVISKSWDMDGAAHNSGRCYEVLNKEIIRVVRNLAQARIEFVEKTFGGLGTMKVCPQTRHFDELPNKLFAEAYMSSEFQEQELHASCWNQHDTEESLDYSCPLDTTSVLTQCGKLLEQSCGILNSLWLFAENMRSQDSTFSDRLMTISESSCTILENLALGIQQLKCLASLSDDIRHTSKWCLDKKKQNSFTQKIEAISQENKQYKWDNDTLRTLTGQNDYPKVDTEWTLEEIAVWLKVDYQVVKRARQDLDKTELFDSGTRKGKTGYYDEEQVKAIINRVRRNSKAYKRAFLKK